MFASAVASPALGRRQAGAYTQMHAASWVDSATPHGLITMLVDGLMGAIAEARGAVRSRNIPAKGAAIMRAVRILDEGLLASLNLEDGGALAAQLRGLYSYVSVRLTHANLHSDEAALEECSQLIDTVRSAWKQIADRAPG